MIYVKEFSDAGKWRFAVCVSRVCPGMEGCFLGWGPGDDGAGFVFAEEINRRVKGGGSVRGEGRRPD